MIKLLGMILLIAISAVLIKCSTASFSKETTNLLPTNGKSYRGNIFLATHLQKLNIIDVTFSNENSYYLLPPTLEPLSCDIIGNVIEVTFLDEDCYHVLPKSAKPLRCKIPLAVNLQKFYSGVMSFPNSVCLSQIPIEDKSLRGNISSALDLQKNDSIAVKIPNKIYKYRLPTNVKPVHYELGLKVDLENFKFNGFIEMHILVTEISSNITFHAYELQINYVQVLDIFDNKLSQYHTFDSEKQFMIIQFEEPLKIAYYIVYINFEGILNEASVGLFRGSYTHQNETRWYAATNFEATHARRAFPCFDEPALKATFNITLIRKANYSAISNTKLYKSSIDHADYIEAFKKTPRMSTYQVAFVISDFAETIKYPEFRVFARPDAIHSGDTNLASDMCNEILVALAVYIEFPLNFEKLDQILIPQFLNKSVEHWGLVIYHEKQLLFNKTTSSAQSKQQVLLDISYAFAHHWFGGLVTPKWWKYLWLQEGIATMLSYETVHLLYPGWRMDLQILDVMQFALAIESEVSRPISWDVDSPHEIQDAFYSITSTKAAFVLRMLKHAMGLANFRSGLVRYVASMQYGAAESADLWNAFDRTLTKRARMFLPANVTVAECMTTWEVQAGYPLLIVTRNYSTGMTTFCQQPFYIYNESIWYIPISWSVQRKSNFGNTLPIIWLMNECRRATPTNLASDEWIIVNNQATGYFRVNYDERNWNLIANYLNSPDYGKIHPLNRAQLLDDAFNLAKRGLLKYRIPLKLTQYLHRETNYIVQLAFFRNLEVFNRIAGESFFYVDFKRRVATILDRSLRKLGYQEYGFDDEHHLDNLQRRDVIYWACRMKHEGCRRNTAAQLRNLDGISANLLEAIVCGGLREANETTWNMVYEYSETVNGTIKTALLSALGCIHNYNILSNYVERELRRDNLNVFENIYNKSYYGKKFVYYWMTINFDDIKRTENVGDILIGLSSHLSTKNQLAMFRVFLDRASGSGIPGSLVPALRTAIRTIDKNIAWLDTYNLAISIWIQAEL